MGPNLQPGPFRSISEFATFDQGGRSDRDRVAAKTQRTQEAGKFRRLPSALNRPPVVIPALITNRMDAPLTTDCQTP